MHIFHSYPCVYASSTPVMLQSTDELFLCLSLSKLELTGLRAVVQGKWVYEALTSTSNLIRSTVIMQLFS